MSERTVQRLSLRAREAAEVRAVLPRLEDAFRTASLPEVGGRLLIIRQLDLGRFANTASAIQLSARIERQVALQAGAALHAARPDAARAPAVWFRDALEAHTLFALALCTRNGAGAWYWRRAVPAAAERLPDRAAALRATALSLAALDEAPRALPLWTASLARAGQIDRLRSALRSADVAELQRRAGTVPPRTATLHRAIENPEPASDERLASSADGDDASRLIAQLLRLSGMDRAAIHQALAPRPIPAARATSLAAYSDGQPAPDAVGAPAASAATDRPSALRPAKTAPRASADPHPEKTAKSGRSIPASPPRSAEARSGPAAPADPDAAPGIAAADPRHDELDADAPLQTVAAGLPLLLNVLQRIGYADWLAGQPRNVSASFTGLLLDHIASALALPADDPVRALAARPTQRPRLRHWRAPAAWANALARGRGPAVRAGQTLFDPSGRLLLAAWSGPAPRVLKAALDAAKLRDPVSVDPLLDAVLEAWCLGLRRWLRRRAGIGLRDLVCRSGAVAVTPTHLDLWMPLAQVELRIRRQGLDLDPGWLPWVGRIVQFHYVERVPA